MTVRRLMADKRARRYLLGQALSLFGDSSLWMACGIWVKSLTGSDGAAGLTFFFYTAPAVLAPLAGLLVDRVRRTRLLLVANLYGAAMLVPLLFVRDAGDVWLIYGVMLGYGVLSIVIAPAQSALLAGLLPPDLRVSANSVLRTVQESLRLIAPVGGAGVFALFGGHVVALIDMVTFLLAAGLILSLRYAEPPPAPLPAGAESTGLVRSWAHQVSAGFKFLARTPALRRLTLATATTAVVLGISESLSFAIVSRGLNRSPEFLGVLQTLQGVGAVAAGVVAATMIRRVGESKVVAIGMLVFAVGTAVTALPTLPFVLTGRALCGAGVTAAAIALLTLLQRLAPHHLQGRVFAGVEVSTTVPQTAAIAAGAYLVGVVDFRLLLAGQAVLMVLAGSAMLFARDRDRKAASEPEPAEPEAAEEPGRR